MNQFQGIESGQGLLKNSYDDAEPLELALKKRREKLMESKGMKAPADIPEPETKLGAQ